MRPEDGDRKKHEPGEGELSSREADWVKVFELYLGDDSCDCVTEAGDCDEQNAAEEAAASLYRPASWLWLKATINTPLNPSRTPVIVKRLGFALCTASVSRSAHIGVVAFRTAAMLLGTVRSQSAKKVNGIALLKKATRRSGTMRRRGGRVRPLSLRTLHRKAAPKVRCRRATHAGGKLRPEISMRRNDAPHTAESRNNWRMSRRLIESSVPERKGDCGGLNLFLISRISISR